MLAATTNPATHADGATNIGFGALRKGGYASMWPESKELVQS